MDRYVDYLPLDDVRPAARNPKGHDGSGINRSISHHGLAELPLIDERTGRLVAGHGRHEQLAAMRDAGQQPPDGIQVDDNGAWHMPVIRGWSSRSDADAEAYLIASNQLTTVGGWQDDDLATVLTDLAELDLLELTGFTDADLADLLDANNTSDGEGDRAAAAEEARRSLAERFGVPPFTLFDARQGYWQDRKRAWINLGLRSEEGRATRMVGGLANSVEVKSALEGRAYDGDGWESGTSIFDPVLCELLIRWYSAPDATVLDPFAGGSVRGIVASRLGRGYTGVDLRPEQVAANQQQAAEILADDDHTPCWITGDARNIRTLVADNRGFDLLLTCPPYHDLETYSDIPGDLSLCADYDVFLASYQECLNAASDRMADDAFAAIVTGPIRGKGGYVNDLPADTTRIMESLGWRLYQDAILATPGGTAAVRAGRQFLALRKLTRVHQVVGVYHRGNLKRVRSWPPPEVGDIDIDAIVAAS